MKPLKVLTSLLFAIIMAMLITPLFKEAYIDLRATFEICAIAFVVLLIVSLFVKMPQGVSFMAVQVEIWQKDILDNLFKDNDFAKRAVNEDQYVIGGKIVHIPVAGAPGKSKKNLTEFPRSAVKRADDEILYPLDTYYREPRHVEKIEQFELSYDKRQSLMGEEQAQLIQDAMEGLIYRWSLTGKNMDAAGNYILTTGAATSEDVLEDATGERKTMAKDVFGKIKKRMDNANILAAGRVALLTANHYQQFLDSLSDAERTNMYRYADMAKGIIGNYLGFDVIMRSTVQRWRKTAGVWAPVDEQADAFDAGADDSAASVFYQEKCVSRAKGEINVFDNQGQAEYYGDIFSMNMRLGGRVRRTPGVYSVIEDIVAA